MLRTMLPMNPPLTDRTTLSASSGYLSKYLRRSLMLPIWSGLPLGGKRRAVVSLSTDLLEQRETEGRDGLEVARVPEVGACVQSGFHGLSNRKSSRVSSLAAA